MKKKTKIAIEVIIISIIIIISIFSLFTYVINKSQALQYHIQLEKTFFEQGEEIKLFYTLTNPADNQFEDVYITANFSSNYRKKEFGRIQGKDVFEGIFTFPTQNIAPGDWVIDSSLFFTKIKDGKEIKIEIPLTLQVKIYPKEKICSIPELIYGTVKDNGQPVTNARIKITHLRTYDSIRPLYSQIGEYIWNFSNSSECWYEDDQIEVRACVDNKCDVEIFNYNSGAAALEVNLDIN